MPPSFPQASSHGPEKSNWRGQEGAGALGYLHYVILPISQLAGCPPGLAKGGRKTTMTLQSDYKGCGGWQQWPKGIFMGLSHGVLLISLVVTR